MQVIHPFVGIKGILPAAANNPYPVHHRLPFTRKKQAGNGTGIAFKPFVLKAPRHVNVISQLQAESGQRNMQIGKTFPQKLPEIVEPQIDKRLVQEAFFMRQRSRVRKPAITVFRVWQVFFVSGDEIKNSCKKIKARISFCLKKGRMLMQVKAFNLYRPYGGFEKQYMRVNPNLAIKQPVVTVVNPVRIGMSKVFLFIA